MIISEVIDNLEYDDAKYHSEHGEVIVDKAVWEDAERALSGDYAIGVDSTGRFVKASEMFCDRNICMANEYNGIGCDECEVTKSQEPSGNLIRRTDLLDMVEDMTDQFGIKHRVVTEGMISLLPSVNPQEPKTGHWIEEDMFDGDVAYRCSECNELFWIESGTPKDNGYDFCPKCGKRLNRRKGANE